MQTQIQSLIHKKWHKKWFYPLVALVAAWWLWSNYYGADGDSGKGPPPTEVSAAAATRRDVPIQIPLVGTVVARESVVVKSRIDSQIIGVFFKDGDFVKEGQILFELDNRELKAQIKQLEAALVKEEAQLVNANRQYERAQKLVKTNVVSQAQVDTARATYEGQLAQVGAAKANLDNMNVQLSYTSITAPISGRTGTINVTRGNNVKANDTQPLVTINQISPIRVQFAIPQRYYSQVKNAMTKNNRLSLRAKHAESTNLVEGSLEYIDNNIDTSSGTFAARASFENKDETLWPGMFVSITLDLGVNENALTVPAVAIQGDENSRFVFKVDTTSQKALRTPVEILLNNNEVAVITNGLSEGDMVITDGMLRVTDGGSVKITDSVSTGSDSKAP
jgi:RND family efflux transporter MFP subunit